MVSFPLFASADPGVHNEGPLSVVMPGGGAYIIVTKLTNDQVTFKYGWNSLKHFEKIPESTLIFVFKGGFSQEPDNRVFGLSERFSDPDLIPAPLKHKANVNLVSGEYYEIHFYVYNSGVRFINLVIRFTAP